MATKPVFPATARLFAISDAFAHGPVTDGLFDEAMREAYVWHVERCLPYARFLALKGADVRQLPATAEVIPPLLVTVFKHHRLLSIGDDEVAIELTSSGTGGQRSAIVLDKRSLQRIRLLVDQIYGSLGLVNHDELVNYLCFSYDPKVAKNVGTAFSDKMMTGFTRRRRVVYAIRWDNETREFYFDAGWTARQLRALARRPEPVRLIGFPAHIYEVCDVLEAAGETLALGERSFVLTGGGWKMNRDREVTKAVFKSRVARILGVPEANIRDTFGMVEHGIPYLDCAHGNMHVPIYARARVVDPGDLRPLPDGQPGLLHLMSPYLTSYPSISLLTTDRAVIQRGCPCGRAGPYLTILGRAGLSKHKGCAINALDLLK